eukprot:1754544-Rhodomonas_salina.1
MNEIQYSTKPLCTVQPLNILASTMPPEKRANVSGTLYQRMEQHPKRPKHSPRRGKGNARSLHAVGGLGVEKV